MWHEMDGWLLYGGRICGSHEGMIIVVAIDTEYGNHLLVTMREAETVEKALASGVTSKKFSRHRWAILGV